MADRRRPRQMQQATVRAVGYIRVSSEDQTEGYSLSAQERALGLYCEAHGWNLVRVYADEGKSAWSDNPETRPQFAAALADAEIGAFDVLIVHKLDRFARNVGVAVGALKTLQSLNVGFVSISEQMDFTTPFGKVALTMLLAFAEFYSDNLSAETKKGKAERKRQGIYNGLLPFGAGKGEDGIPIPDATNHVGLVRAFEMAAAGATDREIAQALNALGYRTTGNRGANRFTKDTVRPMLQNRFYLGELPDGDGGWLPGKHAPLVDTALFDAAAAARFRNIRRRTSPATTERTPWALSSVGHCACGGTLRSSGGNERRRRVECTSRRQGLSCDAPSFYADVVEGQLGTFLATFNVPEEQRAWLIEAWKDAQERRATNHTNTARERQRLEAKAERVKLLFIEGEIDEAEYRRQRGDVAAQLADLPAADLPLDDAVARRLGQLLADLSAAWTLATPIERNAIAREMFTDVVVENRTAVAVKPRPELAPFFASIASQQDASITLKRKRRDSYPRQRYGDGYIIIAAAPDVARVGQSGRAKPISTRAVIDQPRRERIRELAGRGWSLRAIATEVGISHESVRTVISGATIAMEP